MRKSRRELLPLWKMPSDPIKAVFWFSHWLLQVLVRYFWLPIGAVVILETVLNSRFGGIGNGLISGIIAGIVALVIWGVLWLCLRFWNLSTTITDTIADIGRMQQGFTAGRPFSSLGSMRDQEPEGNIVEGTITDLEEERKKRRQES